MTTQVFMLYLPSTYALVSLGKDFLVLELQWVIEFKKIPRLFSKTLSHIYSKKIPKEDGN